MMKFWLSHVLCIFMVGFITNGGYGQTSFGLNISYYLVPRNPISEAVIQDTVISTYDINCLNQLDSIHLKAPQLFDSTRCEFLNYYLNIQRNDSVIEQVIFSHSGNTGYSNLILVKENVYDIFYKTEQYKEFHYRIEIFEKTLGFYYPIRCANEDEETQREMAFDSLNFEYSKYFIKDGFVTKHEYATIIDGKSKDSEKGSFEYSYLFLENDILVSGDNRTAEYKSLNLISFDSPFGMSAMSKFIFIHLVMNDLVGGAYEVHYPIVLFHFPELLEKLR